MVGVKTRETVGTFSVFTFLTSLFYAVTLS